MVLAVTQGPMDQKALMNLNTSSRIPFIPSPPLERITFYHTQLRLHDVTLRKVFKRVKKPNPCHAGPHSHTLVCPSFTTRRSKRGKRICNTQIPRTWVCNTGTTKSNPGLGQYLYMCHHTCSFGVYHCVSSLCSNLAPYCYMWMLLILYDENCLVHAILL